MVPFILRDLNLFDESETYRGRIVELNPPQIGHKMEEYRAGGMLGPAMIDQGLEAMSMEWTLGDYSEQILGQMGELSVDGVMLRVLGAFQSSNAGEVKTVELVMRGRHSVLDRGTWKPGDNSTLKVTTQLSYYKETVNGVELLEIDMLAGIYMVGGVDRYAAIREAIGI